MNFLIFRFMFFLVSSGLIMLRIFVCGIGVVVMVRDLVVWVVVRLSVVIVEKVVSSFFIFNFF